MILNYQQALEVIAAQKTAFGKSHVPLLTSSKRVLASDIIAPCDSPLFTNSAMDGYAFRFSDYAPETPMPVKDTLHAGRQGADSGKYEPGCCVKIMTGAPLPSWADTVVPVEKVSRADTTITLRETVLAHAHVRHQGEDIAKGTLLLSKGTQLDAERILVLAQFGIAEVPVLDQPDVTLFSSGDELVEPGSTLGPGEIFNSSRFFLEAAFRDTYGLSANFGGTLRDNPASATDIIGQKLRTDRPNLMITTGAVSAGDKDFIPSVAKHLGFETLFHKVAIRPGKPVFLARKGGCIWVGLPGNPVSTTVGWEFFVRPLLHHWANYPFPKQQKASIVTDIAKPEGLTCFFRGTLNEGRVSVHQKQGSAQLLASISANTYIILSDAKSLITAGTIVDVQTI